MSMLEDERESWRLLLEEEFGTMEHVVEGCECEGKVCTACELLKCRGSFHYANRSKGYLQSECKSCARLRGQAWYQENKDSVKVKTAHYQKTHPEVHHAANKKYKQSRVEEMKEQNKRWRQQNVQKRRIDSKEYRRSHRGKFRGYSRKYYARNTQKFKAYKDQWIRKNRERYLESSRAWRRNHSEERKAYHKRYNRVNIESIRKHWPIRHARRRAHEVQAEGQFTVRQWEALKAEYNYTCLCCGKGEPEIRLTADHVIPLSKGGTNDLSNIQPLCRSCNSAKWTNHTDFRK